jgi:two-component system OmpR family response regulator
MADSRTFEANRLRVLVADDNRDAADTLGVLLRMWGYQVRVAYDGAQALQVLDEYRPDCLFLDIGMPLVDGYAVARRVRQQPELRGVKLVALTAYSDEEHLRRVWEAGFNNYLPKPADPSEVKRMLEMLAEVKHLAEQNLAMLRVVKDEVEDIREELKEVKDEVKEIREELKSIKEDADHGPPA